MRGFVQGVVEGYIFFLLFAGLLFFSLTRQGTKSKKKARAVLSLTIFSAIIWADYYLVYTSRLPDSMAFIVPAAFLVIAVVFRRTILPFQGRCQNCGRRLSITEFLSCDEHLCAACYEEKHPEARKIPQEERIRRENEERKKAWIGWKPDREFVIAFAFDRQGNVLLIDHVDMPKQPGKYSGVIGEIKSQENRSVAAARTLKRDTGLTCDEPDYMGRLNFVMPDMDIRFHVYIARNFSGELKGRPQKKPVWMPLKRLKYNQMSVDYPLWLPRMLKGQHLEYYAKCNTEGKIYEDILDLDIEI
ncbi:MAG: NUDIX domain-containing protein [Fretibacterium sp.]|nr:NUDIX domain-containing protein [Fretibacterium sp.]